MRPAPIALDTPLALREKAKLRRTLGRWEIFSCLVCALVSLDTISSAASSGAQGFTWLVFLAAVFFIPYGMLIAELGTAFPEEGGPYAWTRRAWGPVAGALTACFYWVTNPIWLGGSLAAIAVVAVQEFLLPLEGPQAFLFQLAFIWLTVLSALVPPQWGARLAGLGTLARLLVLGLFTLSVGLYGLRHGLRGFGSAEFHPTLAGFMAVVPVLVFNFVGFEVPSAAGEELKDPQRDVPRSLAGSALLTVLLYGLPCLAILLVLPRAQVTGLEGFTDAMKQVFTVYGGRVTEGKAFLSGGGQVAGAVAAVGFLLASMTSGTSWLMGADRTLAVAAMEGDAPPALAPLSSKWGTPVRVTLASGVVATLTLILAVTLGRGRSAAYFEAVLGIAISTTIMSYLAMFPALIKLRYQEPEVERPYRVPGGIPGVWAVGLITTFCTVLATLATVWPGLGVGWFGLPGNAEEALPEAFVGRRLEFEATQLIPLALLTLLGLGFWWSGRRVRKNERV